MNFRYKIIRRASHQVIKSDGPFREENLPPTMRRFYILDENGFKSLDPAN